MSLEQRIRKLEERQVDGYLCLRVNSDGFLHLGRPVDLDKARQLYHADIGTRIMIKSVFVSSDGASDDEEQQRWISLLEAE